MNQRLTVPEERAGEPVVVAWGWPRADGRVIDVICPDEHARVEGAYTLPLITLQAHREAMMDIEEMNRQLREQNESVDAACAELEQAIAKKDAALMACVEALELAARINPFGSVENTKAKMSAIAAITQAGKELK